MNVPARPTLVRSLVSVFVYFLVIWTLNAELVPGINESHYLTKAKHAWDPSFAPGDLFLSSGNAHWAFAQLAGCLSLWLPLWAVAWIGRVSCWLLMSMAWEQCARRLHLSLVSGASVLAGWILGTKYGTGRVSGP